MRQLGIFIFINAHKCTGSANLIPSGLQNIDCTIIRLAYIYCVINQFKVLYLTHYWLIKSQFFYVDQILMT